MTLLNIDSLTWVVNFESLVVNLVKVEEQIQEQKQEEIQDSNGYVDKVEEVPEIY